MPIGVCGSPGLATLAAPPGWLTAFLLGAAASGLVLGTLLLLYLRSLGQLRRVARRFAEGDLSQRIAVAGPGPLRNLATALNQMARQLDSRIQAVVQQRNEIETIVSSMVEGVLAIDRDERVISLNRAAAQLLRLDATAALGRSIQEVVRNTTLQALVSEALRGEAPRQTEITLPSPEESKAPDERHLQAQGAALRDAAGQRIGAVVVLHDVTRLRRLEKVRRDFVANVSHEVRTPVSAIKAAVETLIDDPAASPEDAAQFLAIIRRQADRLSHIVDDLLELARIEQDAQRTRLELTDEPLDKVVQGAVEIIAHRAKEKGLRIDLRCEEGLSAKANANLLEQAVVNLLDNAIKYSPAGGVITVTTQRYHDAALITVEDRGVGIEAEHLPRLFERFYRTDKARSRALGGTGLGLAIVKHVASAHGGAVSVDSTPGQGSVFRIHLQMSPGPIVDQSAVTPREGTTASSQ